MKSARLAAAQAAGKVQIKGESAGGTSDRKRAHPDRERDREGEPVCKFGNNNNNETKSEPESGG